MGTRALITVVLPDGTSFNHYQHYDGYPKGVLPNLAAILAPPTRRAQVVQGLANAEKVDQLARPTPEHLARYADWSEQVAGGPASEYYALLRGMQGNWAAMADEGIIVTADSSWSGQSFDYVVDFANHTISYDDGDVLVRLTFDQVVEQYGKSGKEGST